MSIMEMLDEARENLENRLKDLITEEAKPENRWARVVAFFEEGYVVEDPEGEEPPVVFDKDQKKLDLGQATFTWNGKTGLVGIHPDVVAKAKGEADAD